MIKMNTMKLNGFELITPNKAEAQQAQESSLHLATLLGSRSEYQMQLVDTDEMLTIPAPAMQILVHILDEMAQGNAVTFIPVHADLNVQQAAALLNVSRPYLIKILDNGDIPAVKIGTHYRVKFQHLMDYKHRIDTKRLEALQELVDQAQELDMGY